jgi:hypothetical protein
MAPTAPFGFGLPTRFSAIVPLGSFLCKDAHHRAQPGIRRSVIPITPRKIEQNVVTGAAVTAAIKQIVVARAEQDRTVAVAGKTALDSHWTQHVVSVDNLQRSNP